MNYDQLSAYAIDLGNDIVYISGFNDYKLYYMNKSGIETFGYTNKEWFGLPCYKVLQNLDEPCPFCTNKLLVEDQFYIWEYFNPISLRHYSIRDKLVTFEGVLARLEIAVDITEQALIEKRLREKLREEETLISCIQTLRESTDANHAINNLLQIISKYHDAERGYIFEINFEDDTMSNTYEWCAEGISSEIDKLQDVPLSDASRWFDNFRVYGEIYINSLKETINKETVEYETLSMQGIDDIMAAPLYDNNKIVGFLGVDNPKQNTDNMSLIHSVIVFVMDDLKKRVITEKLISLSFSDSLTGVKNRNCYMNELDSLIKNSPNSLGLVFVDVNGLKVANDTFGHQYGDDLIMYTAETLKRIFHSNVFRVGGDEFVVICENIDKGDFTSSVSLLRKTSSDDSKLQISIGTTWHNNNIDPIKQIEATDKMMYLDKQRYYSSFRDSSNNVKSNLTHELLTSINDDGFVVFLQPLIDLRDNTLFSAEALVRKVNKNAEYEYPIQFIPNYEKHGIVRHIDFYVLNCVCNLLASLKNSDKFGDFRISVNFSYLTLLENDIAKQLFDICSSYDVDPKNISIEITESIKLMDTTDMFCELLNSLFSYGFYVSLDGFGSQNFSLSVLSLTKFDEVKLDDLLFKDIVHNPRTYTIVKKSIVLCNQLGFSVCVAKGIETAEQYKLLKELGCSVGQGNYFKKPISIKDFSKQYLTT